MGITTRSRDLEILEDGISRAKTKEGKDHRRALLEAVYEMSKDIHLEKLRRQLVDALILNDPKKVWEIRKKVENYANSEPFKRNIARKIARAVNEKEARLYLQGTFGGR